MRVRYLVIFIIAACLALWIGVVTGALSNAAYFLVFGITPDGDSLDPTILLGLHAMLLVILGYILGYISGFWSGAAKKILSTGLQAKTEVKNETKPTSTVIHHPKKAKQNRQQKAKKVHQQAMSVVAKLATVCTIIKIQAQKTAPKVKRTWQKSKPQIIKFVKLTCRMCIKVLDFIFSTIERIWLWFKP